MSALKREDRARLASRKLVERYFRELESDENRDRKVVYMFTSGGIAELFRAFDFRIVYPEINAVHCSRRNAAVEMIRHGEDLGYSADICSYVKSDLGLMAGPLKGQAPFGKIPPPDLLVAVNSGCSTYIKWAEALSREFGCPLRILDVPFIREAGRTDFDHTYVRGQIEDLIPVCEEISGNKFDEDKLKNILELTGETVDLWKKLLEYGKMRPSPLDSYFDGTSYMAPMTIWRGTREAVEYYRQAVAEMDERVSMRYSPAGNEEYRILFDGAPPWPRFSEFRSMFMKWGAVAVANSYVRVVCACEDLRSDPGRPMDFLAELASQSFYNWNHGRKLRFLEKTAREYEIDGIVVHSVRSCRPMSIGQLDLRGYFAREAGIPALFLDSDIADPRFFSTAQILNRVNTFFGALSWRKESAGEDGKS